jgi:hypothetical protein
MAVTVNRVGICSTPATSVKREKGNFPGRYVPGHLRKWPQRPNEYVSVSEYQEHVEPTPSPVEGTPRQGELDLVAASHA